MGGIVDGVDKQHNFAREGSVMGWYFCLGWVISKDCRKKMHAICYASTSLRKREYENNPNACLISLDLHLNQTVLPDSDEGGGAILAVVHENHPKHVSTD